MIICAKHSIALIVYTVSCGSELLVLASVIRMYVDRFVVLSCLGPCVLRGGPRGEGQN